MRANRGRRALFCFAVLAAAALPIMSGCAGRKVSTEQAPSAKWFDDMRGRIAKEFADPQQAVALTGVVDKMEVTMNGLDKEVVAYYETLHALDKDYNTTREQFQEAVDAFNARQRAVFEEMLVDLAEMKRIAGREGWKKICDTDEMLYESWQREL